MDSIFVLGEDARAAFLRHMMHSFGSDYICLWSYSPLPSNCLVFLDGFYDEEKIQKPSSSSGTLATTLFKAYCGSLNFIDNECVPGFAFKNKVPYLEVKLDYIIPAMLTTQAQMQLYQEAEIKTAVFMGCAAGEIELGFSTQPRVNLQMEIERSWFPADFSTQTSFDRSSKNPAPSIYLDNKNIPISSCFITVSSSSRSEANNILQETVAATSVDSTLTQIPEQQQFPAALLMPILSPRPPLSSHHTALNNHRAAFTRYCAASAPPLAAAPPTHDAHNRSSLFARSLSLLRNLDMMRRSTIRHDDELTMQNLQGNHHTQIRHVIAERKRRHKLNHSFQILRTLLVPQLSKKDKASILSITAKYLSSLRSQMGELKRRNAMLEMQLSSRAQRSESRASEELQIHPSTETRVVGVEIAPYASSTSEEATSSLVLDLRVSLRSRECSLCELVAGILRFLKHHYTNHVTLLSLQSSTRIVESTPVHVLLLTLKVEGDGFDESGFQEAVRRVVDDLPH